MKPWTWRHAIIKSSLPPTTRHVLLTLSCHLNDLGEDCFPSTAMLADETGLSERSVCTHLALAAEHGWFVVRRHGYGKQKWARHEYFPRIPEGFEVPDRDDQGTERTSAPSKKGRGTKALNDVQCHVDKGTEAGSVPSKKALNVVPEGTEPNDEKALNDVQSNTAVNPSIKAAACASEEPPAAAAAEKIGNVKIDAARELGDLLIAMERERGRELLIDRGRDRTHIVAWVGKGVTPDQLRAAHALAVAARMRDSDDRPTYAGFVSTFIGEAMAPPDVCAAAPVTEWWLAGEEVVIAAGEKFGARPKHRNESLPIYRAVVARAAGKGPWIDAILRDAQRAGGQMQQAIVATLGERLMPSDWYAS